MKTETDHTQEFMTYVKTTFPREHLVLKHCDRFTTGIPDLSVSNTKNKSVWIEAKLLDKPKDNIRYPKHWLAKKDEIQCNTVARLGGMYLVYDPLHSLWGFLRGLTVLQHYRSESIIQDHLLSDIEFFMHGDRFAAYRKVVTYLTQEL